MDLICLYRFKENQVKESSDSISNIILPLIRKGDLENLRIFWESLDFFYLTTSSLIALLRGSSVYKNQLPLWLKAYVMVLNKLLELGKNPLTELYGLDRNIPCSACGEGSLHLSEKEYTKVELVVYEFKVKTILLICDCCGGAIIPHESRNLFSNNLKKLRKSLYYG